MAAHPLTPAPLSPRRPRGETNFRIIALSRLGGEGVRQGGRVRGCGQTCRRCFITFLFLLLPDIHPNLTVPIPEFAPLHEPLPFFAQRDWFRLVNDPANLYSPLSKTL